MRFVADTHIIKWYLQADTLLAPNWRKLFEEGKSQIVIPTIGLAELLYVSKKVVLPVSFDQTLDMLKKNGRFKFFPLDWEVIRKASLFKEYEMHDALIMATAFHLSLPLMTVDKKIIQSKLVKLVSV